MQSAREIFHRLQIMSVKDKNLCVELRSSTYSLVPKQEFSQLVLDLLHFVEEKLLDCKKIYIVICLWLFGFGTAFLISVVFSVVLKLFVINNGVVFRHKNIALNSKLYE